MKGVLLAGGLGRRLGPATRVVSKQLLPVYDKPMAYYPLSLLMLAGIRDVLIIATPTHLPSFEGLFGDGSRLGLRIRYVPQQRPEGLAHALLLARSFLSGSPACLVLGDNLLYGHGLSEILQGCAALQEGATIFGYKVSDPRRYGVVEFDERGRVTAVVEKPTSPKSNYAVPGIYFYGPDACELAATLRPSARGELEIAELNQLYLTQGRLDVRLLGRGYAWLDAGTPPGLAAAASFIEAIQQRQGLIVGCLEEIAWDRGWIDEATLRTSIRLEEGSEYGRYLASLLEGSPDFPVSSRRRLGKVR